MPIGCLLAYLSSNWCEIAWVLNITGIQLNFEIEFLPLVHQLHDCALLGFFSQKEFLKTPQSQNLQFIDSAN